ncbi:MAG TPA: SpoIIE family protein phosphatase [Acidobacteriota bacterium]|jgi:serine phosphatase RsbU (regulator of sigma subunit)
MSRILIVEDEAAILTGLKANLEFESHEVITAVDGEQGYSLIRDGEPDLVILDLMLPKLSGFDLCRRVRGEGFSGPILMLSARSTEGDRVSGLDFGANDYVTKPFSLRELLARIRALLRYAEESRHDQKRMEAEIKTAFEVQRQLLPGTCPVIPGFDYAGQCRPALGVSGDYYDFIPLREGRLGLLMADVSGKGMPAALLGASIHAAVRAHAREAGRNCGEVLTKANSVLFDTSAPERFATIFYGVYDARSRTLTYANAGHYPPLLIRAVGNGRSCVRLDSITPPVGMLPTLAVAQRTIEISPGDWLLIVSDGIPEACDQAGEEFGPDRLSQIVKQGLDITAEQLCLRVLDAVRTHTRGNHQADDLTLIAAHASPAR